jgi:hypothetical protein
VGGSGKMGRERTGPPGRHRAEAPNAAGGLLVGQTRGGGRRRGGVGADPQPARLNRTPRARGQTAAQRTGDEGRIRRQHHPGAGGGGKPGGGGHRPRRSQHGRTLRAD